MFEGEGLFGVREVVRFVRYGCVLAAIILLLVVARLTYDAQRHLRLAREALSERDREQALWHFQWALRSYVPGLPANREALAQIENLASMWSKEGQREQAEQTLRVLRASLYAIRSIYQPFPDVLERTERELGLQGGADGSKPTPLVGEKTQERG